MIGRFLLALGLSTGVLGWFSPSLAQLDFAQWLSPGPHAAPHEHLDSVGKCTSCHATAKGLPDKKCLACHAEIAERLDKKAGWHARQAQPCYKCHSDHKGRAYDLTGLSRLPFDHNQTEWPLAAGHGKVKCVDCHETFRVNCETGKPTARRTYLGAPTDCVTCHEDVHQSQRQEFRACERCHTGVKWGPMKTRSNFNHGNETRYPLTGKHAAVKCYACHKDKTWAPLPFARCQDCHADPHKGKLGPQCERCHVTTSWKTVPAKFRETTGAPIDHDKTAFPLRGEHVNVACLRCHIPGTWKMESFRQCSDCHNNPHDRQFEFLWDRAKTCKDCHVEDGWHLLRFRHNNDSRYKLEDRHASVPCLQCHIDRNYRWLAKSPDCDACHVDVHKGQFEGACASCHSYKGFDRITFDHNKQARFPLVGRHQKVPCQSCHEEGKYKKLDTRCVACHVDFHGGKLTNECARCHAPTAFPDVEFDHTRGSRFRLEGKHRPVACNQCHKDYDYKLGKVSCFSCHVDVHRGTFGQACERCHTSAGFGLKTGYHDFGEFSLSGAHDRLDCLLCHGPKSPVRLSPGDCAACHKDPHLNAFGRKCWACHGQETWLPWRHRHDSSGFEFF